MKGIVPFLTGFVISLSAATLPALEFSQSLSLRGGLLVSRADGYEGKTQGGSFFELDNTLAGESFGAALTIGYHDVGPSNLSRGYGYRGYEGVHFGVSAEGYLAPVPAAEGSARRPRLRPGLAAGALGYFSRYTYTDMLIFYPSIRALPFVDILYPEALFRLRFGLPLEYYFRKDLASSWSAGWGVWGVLSWPALAAKVREQRKEEAR